MMLGGTLAQGWVVFDDDPAKEAGLGALYAAETDFYRCPGPKTRKALTVQLAKALMQGHVSHAEYQMVTQATAQHMTELRQHKSHIKETERTSGSWLPDNRNKRIRPK